MWGYGNTRFAVGNDGVVYNGSPQDPLGTGLQVEPNDLVAKTNFAPIFFGIGGAEAVSQLNEEKDQPQNFNRWIWGIWGPSADKIICVGDGGRIMTFDRITNNLTIRPSPTTKSLYAIGGTSLDDIWIVGEGQLVLHGHLSF